MFFRRALIPIALVLTLLVQFVPGTVFAPRPVAAEACDSAQFIADVTIADGTSVSPGGTFVKTWRLKNIGTCTWTTSYAVVFTGGDQLGAPAVVNMPSSVAPGATVDISVNMTAPSTPGHYRGNWKLRNASGGLFGVGGSANYLFWVDINVNTSYGSAYDFVANYCSAAWSSGAGALPCPGTDGDTRGFVLKADAPQLENGSVATTPGLIINPQKVTAGYIQAVYPAISVQAGDRFQSIINCAYNSPNCYVNFRLNYQIGSGPVNTLWSFNERSEGLYYRVNLDLSSLAGQSVNFILYVADVSGHGSPTGDRAEWVDTKIARAGTGSTTPIPPPTTCDKGAFVGDVTIPDGSVLAPGQSFTKTWRVRNIGSCTWTTSYALVFVFGSGFGAAPVINLPSSVAPGATADFSINMIAPTVPGHYRSYWRFRNASGAQFGVGSGMITFFADINVSGTAVTPTFTPTATTGSILTPTATPTSVIVGPNTDLSVTITDGVTSYTPGGTVTYTIVVRNNGPQNVTGATFTDNKPSPHVTAWTLTCAPDSGASCTTGPILPPGSILDVVNIPAGKQIVYTVVATISASAVGNLVNTASITNPGAVPDPNLANNSATDTDAPPSADLAVTVTDGLTYYPLGGVVNYTIVVSNNGPLGATNATFSDPIPSQVTGWTWTCAPSGGAVWTGAATSTTNYTAVVNLPASSNVTCLVAASISSAATGDLVNTVSITPPVGILDAILTNNTASHTDTGPSADLSVTKTDGVTSYTPGGTVTYTIDVINSGPLIVSGATFTDNYPAILTSWTWTCLPDTGATCLVGSFSSSANFTNTVSIPSGNKVRYTVVANVSALATGNLVNTASIASIPSIPDLNPGNNSATDTDLPPSADLGVTVSDGVAYYVPGGAQTYTIDVTNNGPQTVTGATFNNAIATPAQVTSWIWTCTPDAGASCLVGTSAAYPFTDPVTIPAGKKVRYSAVASVAPAAAGDLVDTATIALPAGITDPNPANNTATDTDAHPNADLSVTITDMVTTYSPGGSVIYTIVVTNNGPSNVINATFTGTIPAPALVTNWTWICAASVGASCTSEGFSRTTNFTDLAVSIPAGSFVMYTVTTNINPTASGPMTTTVVITSPAVPPTNVPDLVPANNTATDTDTH